MSRDQERAQCGAGDDLAPRSSGHGLGDGKADRDGEPSPRMHLLAEEEGGGQRAERRPVRDIARGEEQRGLRFAAMLRQTHAGQRPGGRQAADEADPEEEARRKAPSWRRICKVILKNDRMCRGLGFTQHKSSSYDNYRKMMAKRRQVWTEPQRFKI